MISFAVERGRKRRGKGRGKEEKTERKGGERGEEKGEEKGEERRRKGRKKVPICSYLRHKAALECCRDVLTEDVAPPPAPDRVLAVTICPSRCELYPKSAVRMAGLGWYGC